MSFQDFLPQDSRQPFEPWSSPPRDRPRRRTPHPGRVPFWIGVVLAVLGLVMLGTGSDAANNAEDEYAGFGGVVLFVAGIAVLVLASLVWGLALARRFPATGWVLSATAGVLALGRFTAGSTEAGVRYLLLALLYAAVAATSKTRRGGGPRGGTPEPPGDQTA